MATGSSLERRIDCAQLQTQRSWFLFKGRNFSSTRSQTSTKQQTEPTRSRPRRLIGCEKNLQVKDSTTFSVEWSNLITNFGLSQSKEKKFCWVLIHSSSDILTLGCDHIGWGVMVHLMVLSQKKKETPSVHQPEPKYKRQVHMRTKSWKTCLLVSNRQQGEISGSQWQTCASNMHEIIQMCKSLSCGVHFHYLFIYFKHK